MYYAVEANDILSSPVNTVNLLGLNFGGSLGPIKLGGEYNVSIPDSAPAQVAGFVKADVDLGIFTIATNYRVIDKDYNGLGDGGAYKNNQRGFGIDLGLKLGFATIICTTISALHKTQASASLRAQRAVRATLPPATKPTSASICPSD